MAAVSCAAQAISIMSTLMFATSFILYMASTVGYQMQAFYFGNLQQTKQGQNFGDEHLLGALRWCDDYAILGGQNTCVTINLNCQFMMTDATGIRGPNVLSLPNCMQFNAWRGMAIAAAIFTFFAMVFAAIGFCSPLKGPKMVTVGIGALAFIMGITQFALMLDWKNNQFDMWISQQIFLFTPVNNNNVVAKFGMSFVMQTFAWGITGVATLTHYLLLCSCIVPLMKVKTHMTVTEEMYSNYYTKNPAAEMNELQY